jgi:hypothetical protein
VGDEAANERSETKVLHVPDILELCVDVCEYHHSCSSIQRVGGKYSISGGEGEDDGRMIVMITTNEKKQSGEGSEMSLVGE